VNPQDSPLLTAILVVMAVAGCFAILHRLLRTLLRLGMAAAQATALGGYAELSARRGDLTALDERQNTLQRVRGLRRRQVLAAGGWVCLLAIPPALGVTLYAYAASALLWLAPRPPLLRLPGPPPPPR
jgi:hypothetical protein